ncbi:MAG TPA: histidine phosphatase family protein [Chromatiales bacterium]|nr:histidine phosphatase family protein [Chromatiales bacterium]
MEIDALCKESGSATRGRVWIDLLRHGEPTGGERYRGDGVDDPLSPRGWEQMWAAVGAAAGWVRVVSSPLQRCRAFAEALGERLQIPVSVEPELREVGFGVWEGLTKPEVASRWPGALEAFHADPVTHRPRGAEPLEAFCGRVSRALDRLWQAAGAGPVLVVAHAGVLRAAAVQALRMPLGSMYRLRIGYAGCVRLSRDLRGVCLEHWNLPRLMEDP